jgi:glycosyltransferase involved in cell wall biosynthesis
VSVRFQTAEVAGPSPRAGPAARPSAQKWTCDFEINGRFLSQQTTGVQRYAREIVRAMDQILFAANGNGSLLAPALGSAPPAYRAIETRQIPPGQGPAWEQAILPMRARRPLLNLCNTAPALAGKQVVCIHDANIFAQPESYSRAFRHYYQLLQPWVARRAARVTSVSKDAAQQIARHFGVPAREIEVLPNGHEHALRWEASRSTIFDQTPARRRFVLILGSRARHKNIELLVGIASALDSLGLDIVVAGGDSSIFNQASIAQAPNVRCCGRVSDDDLAMLMSKALCLAFPSLTEGFGLPVVEAMALGCPVVSSDRASLPEICGGAALMADPLDAAQWIRHFAELDRSRTLAAELRARGAEQAKKFSWANSARGYLNLFGHRES